MRAPLCRERYSVVADALDAGGSVVNVASVRSATSIGTTTQYDTTKAAVGGLTRGMAVDHAADGIRVNAVCRGPIYTPFHDGGYIEM